MKKNKLILTQFKMPDNIRIYIYEGLCTAYHDLRFRADKLGKDKFISSFCTINGIVKIEIKELENPLIQHVHSVKKGPYPVV